MIDILANGVAAVVVGFVAFIIINLVIINFRKRGGDFDENSPEREWGNPSLAAKFISTVSACWLVLEIF